MSRSLTIVLCGQILLAYAAEPEQREVDYDCASAICGCWEDFTKHTVIEVTDADGEPVAGVSLFCEATREHHGPSNEFGTLPVDVKGRVSPGCGFAAHCEAATIRIDGTTPIGSLQFGRLLRGYETTSKELTFKLVADRTR